MSYKCTICGKGPRTGNTVSHSHVGTKRIFRPNLQDVRIKINGKTKKKLVCSSCLKSNKVQKA